VTPPSPVRGSKVGLCRSRIGASATVGRGRSACSDREVGLRDGEACSRCSEHGVGLGRGFSSFASSFGLCAEAGDFDRAHIAKLAFLVRGLAHAERYPGRACPARVS